ncbi:glyoxalase/bleomycin resistance/extradiol dioxygenase family protein, partial [Rhizobium ruizarguesonis]
SEVHWPNGGRSIYFRYPAGNSLECAEAKIWGI